MKKIFFAFFIILSIILLTSCNTANEPNEDKKPSVVVSILPQSAFVKAIAKDTVDVNVMIKKGASPANYQPSPKEMTALEDASIYYTIGVNAEINNILPNISDLNKEIKIVHLEDYVSKKYEDRYFEDEEDSHDHEENNHDHKGKDPHIWMSPKRVIVMVNTICETLCEEFPENKETYQKNATEYIEKLSEIDQKLLNTFSQYEIKDFIILHPSLGYFADDYGLKMIALEQDGKEATASHLEEVIDYAKENNIKVIFYQTEFDHNQADVIANEIDASIVALEPLSSDYLSNLKEIEKAFKNAFSQIGGN